MVSREHLRFRWGDLLAIVFVVLLTAFAALLFFPKGNTDPAAAEIYRNGQLVKVISLAEDQTFTVVGTYCNVITVQDGKISITESDCPGTDCVHSGWIESTGRSIVCLPNGVEVRVVGSKSDVDFVVG